MRGGDERTGRLVASHARRMRNRGKEEERERGTRGAAGCWKSQLPPSHVGREFASLEKIAGTPSRFPDFLAISNLLVELVVTIPSTPRAIVILTDEMHDDRYIRQ